MIYYFTALVITYSMDAERITTSYILYDKKRHCQEALQGLADPIYNQIYELYEGTMMQCVVSDKVSYMLKPKLRPEMDDRLAIVSDEINRLQREYDDAEWEGDPRSTELAKELNYYNKLHEQGVVFEPKF